MAKINRSWIDKNNNLHDLKNVNGLKILNTQEFNDELFNIKTKLCHGFGSSRFFIKTKQKELNQLWGNQTAPKWLSKPLNEFGDSQIKAVLDQSNKHGIPLQETITNLLMRDKKKALFIEFCNYKELIENDPVMAIDKQMRLWALINENNSLSDLKIYRTFIIGNGFNRLREISEMTFRRFQNLSGVNNQSNYLVKVDFAGVTELVKNNLKDINSSNTKNNNIANNKDKDFEK